MLNELLTLLEQANPEWLCTYSESHEMNLKADTINRDKGFAYIEEYRSGRYDMSGYLPTKHTEISIYFCRLVDFHGEAIDRESVVTRIENEIVLPFISAYNASGNFVPCRDFRWSVITPADAKFDANECGIVLTFTAEQASSCLDGFSWNA